MLIEFCGFEWDRGNLEKSLKKHGVARSEAEEVFFYRGSFVFLDETHTTETDKRYVLLGETASQKRLFVVFTLRGNKVRIISARPMSRKERTWYEEEKKQRFE